MTCLDRLLLRRTVKVVSSHYASSMPLSRMASRSAVGVRFTEKGPVGSPSSVNLVRALGSPHWHA